MFFKTVVFFTIGSFTAFSESNQKSYERVLRDINQKIESVTQDLEPHDFNAKGKVEWLNGLYQLRVHIEKQKEKAMELSEKEEKSRRL